jgi:3-phosphoshikimate 1-carboxyvinyltransferase
MEFLDLPPLVSACGTVRLPGSKSISNRVLLLSALAEGETEVRDLLASDDTHVMLEALKQLGVGIRHEADGVVRVLGVGGTFPVKTGDIFLGNAGTAVRSLTAALALAGGHYKVSGVARMHERPIGDLVNGLREIGADVTYLGNAGFPPLEIRPASIRAGGVVQVRGDVSSQFLTGLLMALPMTGVETTVEVVGELISKPYIEITLAIMARFGVAVTRNGWQSFVVPAGSRLSYRPGWSMSRAMPRRRPISWRWAPSAAGRCGSKALAVDSIQGDVRFAERIGSDGRASRVGRQLDRGLGAGRRNGNAARHQPRLQSHPGRGNDAGDHRPVCGGADHLAQHCQLARQGNRPHRRDGHRVAQARRACRGR